ncbi:hypothetical protein [Prosthecobacter sp.]|uniref:hypothetical protein n=1 Tax=Prosthecobacter sp. TaxID=1965333 RepID=UPI0037841D22
MTATLPFRVAHQFRTEWRHHRAWVLGWTAWVVLHRYFGDTRNNGDLGSVFVHIALLMTVLPPAAMAWLCIRGDSPSNTDYATLTRPMGQGALWLGKVAFLFCGVIVPLLLAESMGWTGFRLGVGSWLALGGGLILCAGLVMGIASALTALTSSTRQVIAIAVLGVLAAVLWMASGETVMVDLWGPSQHDVAAEAVTHCGWMAAGGIAFLGVITAWWVVTVPRRRAAAAALLVLSLMQAPFVAAVWKADWVTPPALRYDGKKLGVKTGKADPADKTPGRSLWPTLRLTGLGKDEVASVVEFAPMDQRPKEWPPLGSYSDLMVNSNGYDTWLHMDHLRALLKYSAPTTLWRHQLYGNGLYNGRPKIHEALKPLHLKPQAMPERWRLRLAVHEMKRVGSMPFKELWAHGAEFPVREGLRVEFTPFSSLAGAWESKGWLHYLHPLTLRPRDHRAAEARGRELADGFLLVLEDPMMQENDAMDLRPFQQKHGLERYLSLALQDDHSQSFEVRLWTPRVQHELLKTTHEDWVNRLNATLWYAEERGTVDLELTAAQMAEVLAEVKAQPQPQAEVKKP